MVCAHVVLAMTCLPLTLLLKWNGNSMLYMATKLGDKSYKHVLSDASVGFEAALCISVCGEVLTSCLSCRVNMFTDDILCPLRCCFWL